MHHFLRNLILIKIFFRHSRYGDRAPKSTPARIISGIWFILGLAMISILNSKFTATMTSLVLGTDESKIAGKHVSVGNWRPPQIVS